MEHFADRTQDIATRSIERNIENGESTIGGTTTMTDRKIDDVQKSYDTVAELYVQQIFGELEHKPIDRELLDRFAATGGAGRLRHGLWAGARDAVPQRPRSRSHWL